MTELSIICSFWYGELSYPARPCLFYPLDCGTADRLLKAGSRIEDFIAPDTLSSALTALARPEPGSIIETELRRLNFAP